MNGIFQSAFLEALGWSLADSLWQMGVLWMLFELLSSNTKNGTASGKYSLGLFFIFAGSLLFIVSIPLNYYTGWHDWLYSPAYLFTQRFSGLSSTDVFMDDAIVFLSALYLFTSAVFTIRLLFAYRNNKKIYGSSLLPANKTMTLFLESLMLRTGLSGKINIWLSEKIQIPFTTGYIKPMILLPVAMLNNLSIRQTEAIIAHEFFHVKRNDYLVNLLLLAADILLFFNPFARLLQSAINKERENSCDDYVLSLGYDRLLYAEALYLLGKQTGSTKSFALAATGKDKLLLLLRIKRLLGQNETNRSFLKPLCSFFLCLLMTGSFYRQPSDHPVKIVYQEATELKTIPPAVLTESSVQKQPASARYKKPIQRLVVNKKTKSDEESVTSELIEKPELQVISFVSDDMKIEFSTIEPVINEPVITVIGDKPLPFVPRSAFYFPDHEGAVKPSGKKTISL